MVRETADDKEETKSEKKKRELWEKIRKKCKLCEGRNDVKKSIGENLRMEEKQEAAAG